jgi:nitrogen fixation-related uncharacterized protein
VNALILTLFVSLVLAAFAVLAFIYVVKQGDHEHNDRLSLLPLEDDAITAAAGPAIEPSTTSALPPSLSPIA